MPIIDRPYWCAGLLALLLSIAMASGVAATVSIDVVDGAGTPVRDAVVYAQGERGPSAARCVTVVVDQVDREFVPFVTPVQTGTSIRFPNRDDIRHHVYSFSPAKTFAIELYRGTAAPQVVMDKPGTVVLGCNIHDHMLAYIFVVDTPHFGATDRDGKAMLSDLPPGRHAFRIWHPRLQDMPDALVQERVVGAADSRMSFKVLLKPERRPKH